VGSDAVAGSMTVDALGSPAGAVVAAALTWAAAVTLGWPALRRERRRALVGGCSATGAGDTFAMCVPEPVPVSTPDAAPEPVPTLAPVPAPDAGATPEPGAMFEPVPTLE